MIYGVTQTLKKLEKYTRCMNDGICCKHVTLTVTHILLHQFTLPPKFSHRVSQAGHCMNSAEGQRFSLSPQVQVSAVTNGRNLV